MAALLRTLIVLALGVAAGVLAMALRPDWAQYVANLAAPVVERFDAVPASPDPPEDPYPNAVTVKNAYDGGFSHFLGPVATIRAPKHDENEFFRSVTLTIVVDSKGDVLSATPVEGPKEFYAAAAAIARQWKFKPFERNGHPILARIEKIVIGVYPPERRRDYRQQFPEVTNWRSLHIKLSRSGCLGSCPSYSLDIAGDGVVTYVGEGNVAVAGKHRFHLDKTAVAALADRFRKADFFSLLDDYSSSITDIPSFKLTIAFDGHVKSVTDYAGLEAGMPDIVAELEALVDDVVGSDRWLVSNAETIPSLVAEGWNFKSAAKENLELAPAIARYGNAATMIELIATGAPLTKSVKGFFERSGTALEIAADRGEGAMLRALLPAARWPKQAIDRALYLAVGTGNPDLLELFSYGADAAYRDAGENNRTVLMSAASSGVPEVVRAVLPHSAYTTPDAGVNAQDSEGKTALILTASAYRPDGDAPPGLNRVAVVALLLEGGAQVDQRDNEGNTALIADHSLADVAAALIKGGADVNAQNKAGETALMHALYVDVAQTLLQAGADPNIRNAKGQNAVEALKATGYRKDVTAFIQKWVEAHPKKK